MKATSGYRRLCNDLKEYDKIREAIPFIEKIAEELGLNLVLIGGMAMEGFGIPRLSFDIDILFSKEDWITFQQNLHRCGLGMWEGKKKIKIKNADVDLLVEGDAGTRYPVPSPDLIRKDNVPLSYPTVNGFVLLKLSRMYKRDVIDIESLLDANKINKEELKQFLVSNGYSRLWNIFEESFLSTDFLAFRKFMKEE